MKINSYLAALLFFTLILTLKNYAQEENAHINPTQKSLPVENADKLFLMTDKTIYVPYEHIWFSAYQLGLTTRDTSLHSLYILLADRYSKKVLTSGRFIMLSGCSTGRLFLPGNIVDGNYALLAYTDRYLQGKPEIIFSKNISLRSTRESPFTILQLDVSPPTSQDTIKLKYFVSTLHSGIAAGINVNYRLYADSELVQNGTQKTNNLGEIYVTTPHKKDSIIKDWEIVLNVTKDTLSKTEIFPVSDKFLLTRNKQPILQNKDSLQITITPDSTSYHARSKVKLKIKCTDANNQPIQSIFSLSCVLSKRVTDTKDISDYYYADPYSAGTPLIKDTSGFSGHVLYNEKKIKRPANLILLGGINRIGMISTDAAGNFSIGTDMLLGEPESELVLSVSGKSPDGYLLQVTEPDIKLNQQLAATYFPVGFKPSTPTGDDALTEQEKQLWKHTLKAVVVKAHTDDNYYFSGADPCGNWTCSCGHWKCDACPPRQKPIKGMTYLDRSTNRSFVYTGCIEDQPKSYIKKLKPLTVPNAFPTFDYKSTDKELASTLYWVPFIKTDDKGEAELVFYTNDLTGVFKCMLQGISNKGPIQTSSRFSVKD